MRTLYAITIISFALAAASCSKNYLDAKPNSSLVVPTTIADFQALLSNNNQINGDGATLGELSCDDFFYPLSTYNSISTLEKNTYTWATDVFTGTPGVGDWDLPYENILLTNLALEGAAKIAPTPSELSSYNNMKGCAYFFRGWSFFELAEDFSPAFDSATAGTDLGIPLKIASDVNQKVGRSNMSETYAQILSDLKNALPLLPATPVNNVYFLPSKAAVYGMLSRVYLSMRAYSAALNASDSALYFYSTLSDYNSLDSAKAYPMGYPNMEIFFDYTLDNYIGINREAYIDSTIYKSYANNDLRKRLYYKPFDGTGHAFRGFYYSGRAMQGGLCTDEMYLTRAECYARIGQTSNAMTDLNTLMMKRFVDSSFVAYTASDATDALNQILTERRKELVYRGIRWNDLRRLNKESQFATTLNRAVNGQSYSLPPNDPRYVFPIPQEELLYNPITQNQR